jgi:hypothetical protein
MSESYDVIEINAMNTFNKTKRLNESPACPCMAAPMAKLAVDGATQQPAARKFPLGRLVRRCRRQHVLSILSAIDVRSRLSIPNAWRKRNPQVLTMTHHGRAELTNAIGLALVRKLITSDAYADTLASFEEDCAEGRYAHTDLLWRATLKRATDLSREHTPRIGCRSLDVLHVASALELEFKRFLTFDLRQQKFARAVGLKVIVPET